MNHTTSDVRRSWKVLPIALLALLTLAACGSDDDSDALDAEDETTTTIASDDDVSTPAVASGSCPIDTAELSVAIEMEMVRVNSETCGFEATSPPAGQLFEVRYMGIDDFVFEGSEGEPVPDVGDGAFWDTAMGDSLLVKSGGRHFSIQVLAMGTGIPEEMQSQPLAIKVARLILGT